MTTITMKNSLSQYMYTTPIGGDSNGVRIPNPPGCNVGATICVGKIHSHGAYTDGWDELFSDEDIAVTTANRGIPLYLVSPTGLLKKGIYNNSFREEIVTIGL